MKITIKAAHEQLLRQNERHYEPRIIQNLHHMNGQLIHTIEFHKDAYLTRGEGLARWLESDDLVEAEITSIQEGYNYYSKSYREWKERRKVLLQAIQSE